MSKTDKSNILAAVHETAASLHEAGVMDRQAMHYFDTICLTDEGETVLAVFPTLSDEDLWLLARSTLTAEEQKTLATLNSTAKIRTLTPAEAERLETLLDHYDRMIVRRAQAATILQQRGYNLHNPQVLRSQ